MTRNTELRHTDADVSDVAVERSDVIDAAAGLLLMADTNRKAAKLRANGGPRNAHHRAWLRSNADVYEAAAWRMQRAADNASKL